MLLLYVLPKWLLIVTDAVDDVKSDFQAKVPSVMFMSPCNKLKCQICVGCEQSSLTSRYLAIYRKLDKRCRQLAVIFRHWAKVGLIMFT